MENLQDEVQCILEKCAKYKVGQVVYAADHDTLELCSFSKMEIKRISVGNNRGYHFIEYETVYSNDRSATYSEDDVFGTLEEMKEHFVKLYTDKWDSAIFNAKYNVFQNKQN